MEGTAANCRHGGRALRHDFPSWSTAIAATERPLHRLRDGTTGSTDRTPPTPSCIGDAGATRCELPRAVPPAARVRRAYCSDRALPYRFRSSFEGGRRRSAPLFPARKVGSYPSSPGSWHMSLVGSVVRLERAARSRAALVAPERRPRSRPCSRAAEHLDGASATRFRTGSDELGASRRLWPVGAEVVRRRVS